MAEMSNGFYYRVAVDIDESGVVSTLDETPTATACAALRLTDHNELPFMEKIDCASKLYGGRTEDENIVAIPSM